MSPVHLKAANPGNNDDLGIELFILGAIGGLLGREEDSEEDDDDELVVFVILQKKRVSLFAGVVPFIFFVFF